MPPPPKFSGNASRPIDWGNSESTVTVLPSTAVVFHVTYRGTQSMVPPNTTGNLSCCPRQWLIHWVFRLPLCFFQHIRSQQRTWQLSWGHRVYLIVIRMKRRQNSPPFLPLPWSVDYHISVNDSVSARAKHRYTHQPECPPAMSVTPRFPLAAVHSGDVTVHSDRPEWTVTSQECTVASGERGVTAGWRTLRLVSKNVNSSARSAIW